MWFSDEKVRKGGKWCVLGCLSSALSDENNQRWRHNRRDPWWCSLRPRYNDPSEQGHTSNEWDRPLPNTQHPHKNKVLTKRGGDGLWEENAENSRNQMYNVYLAWCFNQIWSYQLYKTAGGRFQNADMILFTLNTSNGDPESSFTYLARPGHHASRPTRIWGKNLRW